MKSTMQEMQPASMLEHSAITNVSQISLILYLNALHCYIHRCARLLAIAITKYFCCSDEILGRNLDAA